MKLPAFQFYPGDWRKDPGVQALSRHDRSVWFDMLLIMHESDERGVLLLAGKPVPDDALARMLNLDNQIFNQTLSTILTYGVASRRESDGAIISRRMVRDENLIQIRREAGKQGGNPVLLKQKPTTPVNQNPTPSSSSSSSSSDVPPLPPKGERVKKETSEDGQKFAAWFRSLLPESLTLSATWKADFARSYDEMIRIDKRTDDEISEVCEFGTTDPFWSKQLKRPGYLRKISKTVGIQHFDQILDAARAKPEAKQRPTVNLATCKL